MSEDLQKTAHIDDSVHTEEAAEKMIENALKEVNRHRSKSSPLISFVRYLAFIILISAGLGAGVFLAYPHLVNPEAPTVLKAEIVESAARVDQDIVPIREKSERVADVDLTQVDAATVLAYNPYTGQQYVAYAEEERRAIASITKLMTTLVALEVYSLDQTLELQRDFPIEIYYGLGLNTGDQVTVDHLIQAMLVSSANDAAYLLAMGYQDGGLEGFVELMNLRAQEWGMYDTKFDNPAGYDGEDNYSTGRDLQILVAHALRSEYILGHVAKTSSVIQIVRAGGRIEPVTLETTNDLLGSYQYNVGLKTGFTTDARQSFVGYFVTSDTDQLVTIILGSESNRFDETLDLIRGINEAYR